MSYGSEKGRTDFLIRLTYLLPLFLSALLLLPMLIPHFFYYQEKQFSVTLNLPDLLGYLWSETGNILSTSGSENMSVYYLAILGKALVILSWVLLVWYAVFAVSTAVLSIWTFAGQPTEKGNLAKRVYRILVPNRGFYIACCLIPVPISLMPFFYRLFAEKMAGSITSVAFYGPPDIVYAGIAAVFSILPFCLLLRSQKERKLDLFRIYSVRR